MRTERKATVMIMTENIEMELFSSEEPCVVIQKVEMKEHLEKHTSNQASVSLTSILRPKCLHLFSCGPVVRWQVLLKDR